MAFRLESPAFKEGRMIPRKYTCQGEDISPPLKWLDVPEGTKSFALTCDDPDAPLIKFVHWVIYGIPLGKNELPEGIPKEEVLETGEKQGKDSAGKIGYRGPCPPGGRPHRYYFRLYALDTELDIKPGVKKKKLLKAMEGHILAKAELMGKYART
jgi:Raf kinase inhibitor-like YbhB/YbcL family protein